MSKYINIYEDNNYYPRILHLGLNLGFIIDGGQVAYANCRDWINCQPDATNKGHLQIFKTSRIIILYYILDFEDSYTSFHNRIVYTNYNNNLVVTNVVFFF